MNCRFVLQKALCSDKVKCYLWFCNGQVHGSSCKLHQAVPVFEAQPGKLVTSAGI